MKAIKKIIRLLEKTLLKLKIDIERKRVINLQNKLEKKQLSLFELNKKYYIKFYESYD